MARPVDPLPIIVLFGLFVAGTMWLVKRRHEANQRERDDVAHLEDVAHH
jgi:LPLT family lysophospholipid transporter-like MFS transporter